MGLSCPSQRQLSNGTMVLMVLRTFEGPYFAPAMAAGGGSRRAVRNRAVTGRGAGHDAPKRSGQAANAAAKQRRSAASVRFCWESIRVLGRLKSPPYPLGCFVTSTRRHRHTRRCFAPHTSISALRCTCDAQRGETRRCSPTTRTCCVALTELNQ